MSLCVDRTAVPVTLLAAAASIERAAAAQLIIDDVRERKQKLHGVVTAAAVKGANSGDKGMPPAPAAAAPTLGTSPAAAYAPHTWQQHQAWAPAGAAHFESEPGGTAPSPSGLWPPATSTAATAHQPPLAEAHVASPTPCCLSAMMPVRVASLAHRVR